MVSAAIPRPRGHDPTHYPFEEKVGESVTQTNILHALRPMMARYLRDRGVTAFVGCDQFIYWVQHEPTTCVSPDLYVMEGVAPDTVVKCWKLWEYGAVPSFVLEVVSRAKKKDYERSPLRHGELGVKELVIYDPEHMEGSDRILWQVYRRVAKRGFVQVERSDGDRVYSRALRCWLRAVGEGERSLLRIGIGAKGEELVQTDEEARETEAKGRAAAEGRLGSLEAEVARLRSELERAKRR